MFLENRVSRKALLYGIFALFVLWIIINPDIPLSYKDGTLLILFFALLHSLIDNRYMLSKLSQKYEEQSKLLSCIFRNGISDNEHVASYILNDSGRSVDDILVDKKQKITYKIAKKTENGEIKLYDACVASVKDQNNAEQDYVSFVKDISAYDILKERIMIQNAQLSSILNNMPFVIYVKDTNGKFIAGNKKLETLIGRKNEELVGRAAYQILEPLSDARERIIDEDKRVVNNKETLTIDINISLFGKEPAWFRVIKAPVVGPNDKVMAIIAVVKNVNKEKEAEHQKDTFIATLTHDLKTPTNAQISVMDILLSGSTGPLTEEQRDLVVQAKNSNVYMANMIATILATYKSEETQTPLEPEEFDFFEMINDTCKELASLADTREQRIILKSYLKNNCIIGDKLQLKRASTNLISNAIIHGFEKTEVTVELNEKMNEVHFDVKNNSRYIEEERRAEIFEKYKSAKYAKSNKASTGLGLYLSRDIIRKHFGEIYVDSWRNETCVFGFKIPKDLSAKIKQAN